MAHLRQDAPVPRVEEELPPEHVHADPLGRGAGGPGAGRHDRRRGEARPARALPGHRLPGLNYGGQRHVLPTHQAGRLAVETNRSGAHRADGGARVAGLRRTRREAWHRHQAHPELPIPVQLPEILPPQQQSRRRPGRRTHACLGNDLLLGRDRPEVAQGPPRPRSVAWTYDPFRHGRPLWDNHVPDSEAELEAGRLDGFRLGDEWRITEDALLRFMGVSAKRKEIEPMTVAEKVADKPGLDYEAILEGVNWRPVEPFSFNWPNGPERFGEAVETKVKVGRKEYRLRVGFCIRKAAGDANHRRAVIFLGQPPSLIALVEFAGEDSDIFETSGRMVSVIKQRGSQQHLRPGNSSRRSTSTCHWLPTMTLSPVRMPPRVWPSLLKKLIIT